MKNARQYLDNRLNSILPQVGIDNWEFILKIHRELIKGFPLSKSEYYKIAELSNDKADVILQKMGEVDAVGNVVAFAGLSVVPTTHRFEVNGKALYTWCVIDAILFTDWLDVNAHITSADPIDHSSIELEIDDNRLLWTKPYPLFISWVETIDTCNIRGSLCNHVSFFASESTANQWLKNNDGGKILSIDDFFTTDADISLKCC